MPGGTVFGIQRRARAFVDPAPQLGTVAGLGDVQLGLRTRHRHPAVSAERHLRPFDAAAEQALAEALVEASDAVHVDGAVVDPDGLHDGLLAGGAQAQEHGLIGEVDQVVVGGRRMGTAGRSRRCDGTTHASTSPV
jgi:hypothetical protein